MLAQDESSRTRLELRAEARLGVGLKSITSALSEMLETFRPLGCVRVGLHDSLGLFLAEEVRARIDQPPFDNSAMDGYAVCAADVSDASSSTPVTLQVMGESRAGGDPPAALVSGRAMRIFTGAPIPAGADAVVMQEDTERAADRVAVKLAPRPGKHIRRRAENVSAGDVILDAGAGLGPAAIGLLASQHHASVTVRRRPQVAILTTGDELRDVVDPPEPGTIVNSNAYALAAQVREAGGVPWVLPIVSDIADEVDAAVREGLRADVLLTVGGVSVGEYDLVRGAFERVGVTPRFWKVAIKPGKPLSFGLHDETPVIGLPGNPVSVMVTFEVFVRPGLRAMLGDPRPFRPTIDVALAEGFTRRAGRTELARGAWVDDAQQPTVRIQTGHGSGSVASMSGAHVLVVLPAHRDTFMAGERLSALRLDGERGAAAPPFRGD